MRSTLACTTLALVLVAFLWAAPVHADSVVPSPALTGMSAPRPQGLLPSSLFDPSRFSISNTLSFGYAGGSSAYGGGTAGLFTSSLGYRMSPNMNLRVNVGANINPAYGGAGLSRGIFLEGASFDWHPTHNSLFRVEYRDMRSPLQNGWGSGYGYGSPLGYAPYGSTGLPGDPSRN